MPLQEFAHPQARFLHEKQRSLSPRTQRWLSGLLGTINRASFKAIDGAMFVGTVRLPVQPPNLNILYCLSLYKEVLLTCTHGYSWQTGRAPRLFEVLLQCLR